MNEDQFFRALEEGNVKKARSILGGIECDLPRARQLYLSGLLSVNTGDLEEALKKFNNALVLHLSDPALWLAKAKVLEELGRMDMARRAASRACKLSSGDPSANLLYAGILYKMKDLRGSMDQVDIVLDLAPEDPEGLTLKGILISTLNADYRKALTYFDSAIENDEDNASAWTNRGIALRQIGDNDGAIFSFQKALMLDPDDKVSREMLTHMGAKKYIVKSHEKKKRKWSRSRYMTDSFQGERDRTIERKRKGEQSCKEDDDPSDEDDMEEIVEEMEELDDIEVGPEAPDADNDGIEDEIEEERIDRIETDRDQQKASDPDEWEELDEIEAVDLPRDTESDDDEIEDWDAENNEGGPVDVHADSVPEQVDEKSGVRKVKKKVPLKKRKKKKKEGRPVELICPECQERFTVIVKGKTEFNCPGCGLDGIIE